MSTPIVVAGLTLTRRGRALLWVAMTLTFTAPLWAAILIGASS